MAKKMLIDATHPEETRVVVVDGNKVEDFDFESVNKRQLAGNIYLAKVTRVEPSLQAAFIEYGGNRHGFLAFSEIHPDYYQIPVADREALLAEEAREEAAERDREEERETGAKPRRGRGRSRSDRASKPRQNSVSGLEVVDLDAPEGERPGRDASSGDVPRGLEVADTGGSDGDRDDGAIEPARAKPAADDATPAGSGDTNATGADTAPDGGGTDDDTGGTAGTRTIAESAGLEDGERVTEEIGEADDRPRESDDATENAAENGAEDRAADERPAGDTAPPAGDAAADTGDDAAAKDADTGATVRSETETDTNTDGSANSADEGAETGRRRRRRRRSRDDKAEAATDSDKTASGKTESGGAEASDSDDAASGSDRTRSRKGGDDQSGDDVEQPENLGAEDTLEEAARARSRLRRRYKIQDVVKVRQILLVQVVKEERGNKGAALTTYLSLAGRYCVLMPNTARGGGISRKITNASDRKRLREIAGEMEVPRGMGLIVRTAGADRTRAEIKRDYEFLLRQWEQIRDLTLKSIAPTLIYEEGSLIKRSIRDLYSKEIDQIQVEGEAGYREAKEYMKMLMPSHAKNVQPYAEPVPLFSRYQVESYLNGMFNPKVQLKSGGYIVIGITEALVAIDVNSGRATKQGSIEETALQTNLEAADEVSRQLRLRDLAGLIVIDFIDMDENRNNRAVEKRMKDKLKTDRARIQVGRISAFGLMEMSRQRLRPGMLEATTKPCPHCHGMGLIRSDDSLALAILRDVEEEAIRGRADELTVRAPVDIANYLVNAKRRNIAQVEERNNVSILIVGDPALISPNYEIERSKGERKRPAPAARDVVSSASVAMPDEAEDEPVREARGTDRTEGRTDTRPDGRDGERSDRPERAGGSGSDDDSRSRRRRGRRGGRRRRGEGDDEQGDSRRSDNRADESRADDQRQPAEAGQSADAQDDRGYSDRDDSDGGSADAGARDTGGDTDGGDENGGSRRRSRSRRRRGRKGDDQAQRDDSRAEGQAESPADAAAASGDPQAMSEDIEGQGVPDTAPAFAGSAELGTGGEPTGGTPPPSRETPADVAGLEATMQRGEPAGSTWTRPEEMNAGDGSTAAAEQDADLIAARASAPSEPQAPAEGLAESPEEAHGGDSATTAAEQDQQPAAEEPPAAEDKPDEPSKPKKRGWWSLGL